MQRNYKLYILPCHALLFPVRIIKRQGINVNSKKMKKTSINRCCITAWGFMTLITLLLSGGCGQAGSPKNEEVMKIEKRVFGQMPDGREVHIFRLENSNGMIAEITNYGAIVTSLEVPDREGELSDIVLGFESLDEYLGEHPYFGAVVGRYANRIAGARFELDGNEYRLAANDGNNHLHGGIGGFDKRVWDFEILTSEEGASRLLLTYLSPDGEEGYLGNLQVSVICELNDNNELRFEFMAETDKATPVNLAHHGYFNLNGGTGPVLDHDLQINAGRFTGVNDELIPTGKLLPVDGGPMDFRDMKPVGRDIAGVPGGYDHNYVLDGNEGEPGKAAVLYDPASGRQMEVLTTQPGVQLYTGNFLDGTITGREGVVYGKYWGLCLETQHFPDSPNQPSFPNTILRPGEEYKHTAVYRFSAR